MKRLTTSEWVAKAKKHLPQFDYTKVNYTHSKTKVEIVCPMHGSFFVLPPDLLRSKKGCPKCSGNTQKPTEEFAKEMEALRPEYSYHKVVYKTNKHKVCIVCPKHGDFWIRPVSMISAKQGCPQCGNEIAAKKNTNSQEAFIKRAKTVHGDFYTYENSVYKSTRSKIVITCPIHGNFEIKANNFLNGSGCNECALDRIRIPEEQFLEHVCRVHSGYDLSHINYKGLNEKIKLICPKHGEFFILAKSVWFHNRGCPKCKIPNLSYTKENFIEEVTTLFPRLDYSEVQYKNKSTKVKLSCPEHGVFWRTPQDMLKSPCGCPQCGALSGGLKLRISAEEIMHQIQEYAPTLDFSKFKYESVDHKSIVICPIHGEQRMSYRHVMRSKHGCTQCNPYYPPTTEEWVDKFKKIRPEYTYEKVEYVSSSVPIIVTCPKHGDFSVTPNSIQSGSGCPFCRNSHGERLVASILKRHKIVYQPQKKFPKMEYIRPLKCDFYLPEYNIVLEYHGQQHMGPVEIFGGEEGFRKTVIRDNIKEFYCKENDIHYIMIPYFYSDTRVYLEILMRILNMDSEEAAEIIFKEQKEN